MTKKINKEVASEPKFSKFKAFVAEVKQAIVGVGRLAFVSASGVGAYTLWFSTDSLTLHIVAVVLVVRTAVDALRMSR